MRQLNNYSAYIPAPLPPEPPIAFDGALLQLVSRADQALGRLDSAAQTMPSLDLFVAMDVRLEAVLSSQIEGTQSTLDDVLEFELNRAGRDLPRDVEEVVNDVEAMNYGLRRLETLPLSLRLIREIHSHLLEGVGGNERDPGEFRRTQNWISAGNASLAAAAFIPPPVPDMHAALDNFEKFLHSDPALPVLIQCDLLHAQFETIHPFLDGNGRVGLLLSSFLLCQRGFLSRPILYLSHYLKRHRAEYYDRLMAIRHDGDWEGWLKFFIRGVAETGEQAAARARAIVELREQHRDFVQKSPSGLNGLRLLDLMFERPFFNVNLVSERLGVSYGTANKLADQLAALGIIEETTGGQRNRRFRYSPYLALFADVEPVIDEGRACAQGPEFDK